MFNRLKEKLKAWFSSSKEKIEKEESEKKVKPPKKQKVEKSKIKKVGKTKREKLKNHEEKIESIIEKTEKIIEKGKEEKIPEIPQTFEVGKLKSEPDIIEIKELVKEKEDDDKLELELEKKPVKKSFFFKLKSAFSYKISENEFNEMFDDLEILLLENNVALEVVEELRKKLSEKLIGKEIKRERLEEEIKNELHKSLDELIIEPDNPLDIIKTSKKPFIILFFGINGSGKTTSIAKIAYFLKEAGFKVVLAAADTFRAASIEQISEHARKLNVPIIKHDYGSDPAAVGFDAIKFAKTHNYDVVLIDTAGRMHTKVNLLEEMKKIERVTKPDLKILVAESIAGNDAVEQARKFHEAIEIDGFILTKADVDEKGGTIISVSHATNKPILYLGTGQKYNDLELFNKEKFIESLGL